MASTQKTASPKKSQGFTGVRGAFWIIIVCAIIAFSLFYTWFANGMHFQDGDSANSPIDVWEQSLRAVSSCLLSTHCCSL